MNDPDFNELIDVLRSLGLGVAFDTPALEKIVEEELDEIMNEEITKEFDALLNENTNLYALTHAQQNIIAIQERAIADLNVEVASLHDELDLCDLLVDEKLASDYDIMFEEFQKSVKDYDLLMNTFIEVLTQNHLLSDNLAAEKKNLADLQEKVNLYSDYATKTAEEMRQGLTAIIEAQKEELHEAKIEINRLEDKLDDAWMQSGYCE